MNKTLIWSGMLLAACATAPIRLSYTRSETTLREAAENGAARDPIALAYSRRAATEQDAARELANRGNPNAQVWLTRAEADADRALAAARASEARRQLAAARAQELVEAAPPPPPNAIAGFAPWPAESQAQTEPPTPDSAEPTTATPPPEATAEPEAPQPSVAALKPSPYETAPAAAAPAPQKRASSARPPATATRTKLEPPLAAVALDSLSTFAKVADEARGTVITVPASLLFTPGKAALTDTGDDRIREIATSLRDRGGQVTVEVHTDSTGTAAANTALSVERAKFVRQQLIYGGLDPQRIDAKGVGAEHPLGDNGTEQGRSRNRRVEIIVAPPAEVPVS